MYVSILGDSISTYEGFNPPGHAVYYDSAYRCLNGLTSVYDTWWAKVNQFLKAYLCVNNAWSGSRVCGDFPAASHPRRTGALHTEQARPDLILIYMGFNDFAGGSGAGAFEAAYDAMVAALQANYPRAWIFCGTLMRSKLADDPGWVFPRNLLGEDVEDYNAAIRRVCRRRNCVLADLAVRNVRYETLDGTHPTAAGHAAMAQCWIDCLRRS